MTWSPTYKSRRLREIHSALCRARFDLAKITESSADLGGLDATILWLERQRTPVPMLAGDPW